MQHKGFSLKDIILLALIGIVFGVIFVGAGYLYNIIMLALTPIGFGPAAEDITIGLWCMAGPLAGFLLRRPGAAFLGEVIGAVVEMLIGDQWGAANLLSGAIQGLGSELGFAFTGYKVYNWLTTILTTLTTCAVTFVWDWFKSGYDAFKPSTVITLLIIRVICMFIIDGVLVKLISNLLERSQVLRAH